MAEGLREINHGTVQVLALDRPERRNSIDIAVTRVLVDALERAAKNNDVKAIVLQGYSHGFGAGSDLKALAGKSIGEMILDEREMGALARSFNRHPKPIIAAVDGYAVGGGAIYAAACDVVFTNAQAKWALPEVPIGMNVAYGISTMQARLRACKARHILWGVKEFSAETAIQIGLADFLTEDSAAEAALNYATRLAKLPQHAVAYTKQLCAGQIDHNAVELDDRTMTEFARCLETESAQTTLRKFGMISMKIR